MSFDVEADAYASFMGRYAVPLADLFVELVAPRPGSRVLDVGCGPGTVSAVLVGRVGADHLAAVDPSPTLVGSARERFREVDVREAAAEDLPFDDETFDAAVAQLVVPFMADPLRGLSEMRRVVRVGGLVAACAWDVALGPIAPYWRAAERIDPGASRHPDLPGGREGQLGEMMRSAGLEVERDTTLTVHVEVPTFEEWWEPFGFGIGPAGQYFVSLSPDQQDALRGACLEAMPEEPLRISGTARATVARRR